MCPILQICVTVVLLYIHIQIVKMKYSAVFSGSILTFVSTSGALGATTPAAWATSSDQVYKLSSYTAPIKGGSSSGSSTWSLQVDDTSSGHKQTIDGFGGQSKNHADLFCIYIMN